MDYVTADEIAGHFRVTKAAVYKWIKQGRIRAVRLGSNVRIPKLEFDHIKTHGLREKPEEEGNQIAELANAA